MSARHHGAARGVLVTFLVLSIMGTPQTAGFETVSPPATQRGPARDASSSALRVLRSADHQVPSPKSTLRLEMHKPSADSGAAPQPRARESDPLLAGTKLVIFDKDGTLISFDQWGSWAENLMQRLYDALAVRESARLLSARHVREAVAASLGYDLERRRVAGEKAPLAWAAQPVLRTTVEDCLVQKLNASPQDAAAALSKAWREAEEAEVVALSGSTRQLLETLAAAGIKVGVVTSDARVSTEVEYLSRSGADAGADAGAGAGAGAGRDSESGPSRRGSERSGCWILLAR
jgi:phosphoglycolate phosphatase-like HAD superfamily hydrolase